MIAHLTIATIAGWFWGFVAFVLIREGWANDGAYRWTCWLAAAVGTIAGAIIFAIGGS